MLWILCADISARSTQHCIEHVEAYEKLEEENLFFALDPLISE